MFLAVYGSGQHLVTQELRNLAERLVAQQISRDEITSGPTLLDLRVCEELRAPLSALAGKAGFQALISRALKLATDDFPRLKSLRVNANGNIEGSEEIRPALNRAEAAKAEIALVARILELLSTFMGETLTTRLIEDLWPSAYLDVSGKETIA